MIKRLAGILTTALVAIACGGGTSAPPSSRPAATEAPATMAPPATMAAAATTAPAVDALGVPECDAFARKYLACLDRVPASGQAMARQSFDSLREHWRRVASNPARRSSLAEACRRHEEITKKAMAQYGCAW